MYDPQSGFFTNNGVVGRGGDFITSSELGTVFAELLANAIDIWWQELGEPDPFVFVEVGAGVGTLARDVLDAKPRATLQYITVEASPRFRTAQLRTAQLRTAQLRSDQGNLCIDDVVSMERLPSSITRGVIFANELLDNLPVDLAQWSGGRWQEVRVGVEADVFVEVLSPIPDDSVLRSLVPTPEDDARIPLQRVAADWLQQACSTLTWGKVVCIDYAHPTQWMAERDWGEWLRTYAGQMPGSSPLLHPGLQDITCEVASDQLALLRRPSRETTQQEFLNRMGSGELSAQAEAAAARLVARGERGLELFRVRDRISQLRALRDPAGLGGFTVFEWDVDIRTRKNRL